MGLIADYQATLKAPEVEEHVDYWVHRPLGFVLAKLAFPTPITPNQITVASILAAFVGGGFMLASFPHHRVFGALMIVISAGLDCADGQLARMRRTSSALGRMLDGVADVASIGSVAVGAFGVIVAKWGEGEPRRIAGLVALAVLTILASANHTAAYDQYKNVWLRMTRGQKEGEDLEDAAKRKAVDVARGLTILDRIVWGTYMGYLERQRAFLKKFDPWTPTRLETLPQHDAVRAEIYRRHASRMLWLLRAFYGTGTLLFTIAIAVAFNCAEVVFIFRLVILTPMLYLIIGPLQRRASRAAFEEMGVLPEAEERAHA